MQNTFFRAKFAYRVTPAPEELNAIFPRELNKPLLAIIERESVWKTLWRRRRIAQLTPKGQTGKRHGETK